MYKLSSVTVSYPSGASALENITYQIPKNAWIAVTGRSGAGKSTFLSLLRGDMRPTTGTVYLGDIDLYKLSGDTASEYRRQIGSVYQDAHFLGHLNVFENVALSMEHAEKSPEEIDSDVPYVLGLMGLAEYAHRYPHELSGGERQRLQLARAFVHQPEILLVDEPLAHLDRDNQERVLSLLKTLHGMGTTLITTAHHNDVFNKLPTHTITLENGGLI